MRRIRTMVRVVVPAGSVFRRIRPTATGYETLALVSYTSDMTLDVTPLRDATRGPVYLIMLPVSGGGMAPHYVDAADTRPV